MTLDLSSYLKLQVQEVCHNHSLIDSSGKNRLSKADCH
jgi:hypothetical protein